MHTTTDALIFFSVIVVIISPFIIKDMLGLFTSKGTYGDVYGITEEEYAIIIPTLQQMDEEARK